MAYAFLEQSGKLSIFLKEDGPLILPLILDGFVDKRHLRIINKDENWLQHELMLNGYLDIKEIFYCSYEDGKWFVQLRARKD